MIDLVRQPSLGDIPFVTGSPAEATSHEDAEMAQRAREPMAAVADQPLADIRDFFPAGEA